MSFVSKNKPHNTIICNTEGALRKAYASVINEVITIRKRAAQRSRIQNLVRIHVLTLSLLHYDYITLFIK